MRLIDLMRRRIKNRFLKKALRMIKEIYFVLLGALGTVLFLVGRFLRLMPQEEPCSQEDIVSKDKIKKVLVVRTDRIGDVICSLPAVKALKENFSSSSIDFLVTPYTEDLLTADELINEVLVYNPKMSLSKKIAFLKSLKKYKFDLAVVLSPYFTSALLAYASGARLRLGYPVSGCGFLLTMKADVRSRFKHEIESCLDVVRMLGIDTEDKIPHLTVSSEAEEYAAAFLNGHDVGGADVIVGIHPGAFQEYKRWTKEGFAEVSDRLIAERGLKVVLFGGPSDSEMIKSVLGLMKNAPLVSDSQLSLQQLAALIKRCHVFLTNNSGPLHIAAAVGTPTVAIFGNIHPLDSEQKWAPYGEKHLIVRKKMDCLDCHPGHCDDYQCMKRIGVEDVMTALDLQISRL